MKLFWGITVPFALLVLSLLLVVFGNSGVPPAVVSFLGLEVRIYTLTALAAIFAAIALAVYLSRQAELAIDVWETAVYTLLPALLFARLYYVVTEVELGLLDFFAATGGMSIVGGIFGGVLGLFVYSRLRGFDLASLLAITAVVMPLGQMIGRLGNFFNQELYGLPTSLAWGIFIEPVHRVSPYLDASHFHPLFAYEIWGNLVIFLILFWVWQWRGVLGYWFFVRWYLIGYASLRFVLDSIRIEGVDGVWVLSWAQWIAFGVILGCLLYLLLKLGKSYG